MSQDACDDRYKLSVCPAYETITERAGINDDAIQTLHNPAYNGVVVHSGSDIQVTTYPVYAEISEMSYNMQNQRNHTINVLSSRTAAPLSPSSETGSFVSQVPSPYLVPQRSPRAARANADNQVQNPSPYTEAMVHHPGHQNTSYRCTSRQDGLCTSDDVNTGLLSGDCAGTITSNPSKMDNVRHKEPPPPIYESI